jgi:hypothetical protein
MTIGLKSIEDEEVSEGMRRRASEASGDGRNDDLNVNSSLRECLH